MFIRRMAVLLLAVLVAIMLPTAAVAADNPQSQAEPETGVLTERNTSDYGVLKMIAPQKDPVYVKILRYNPETGRNKKNPIMTLYIREGESLTVDMPSGDFTLRYATGPQWYGQEDLFGTGEQALYAEADKRLEYASRGAGYEVTLQVVRNGNLPTTKLTREKF